MNHNVRSLFFICSSTGQLLIAGGGCYIRPHMTTHRDRLMKSEAVTLSFIEKALPDLTKARDDLDAFHALLRNRDADGLETIATLGDDPLVSLPAVVA